MGLIKAVLGAASGVLADSWKEFFYCDAIPSNVLVVRGHKRISAKASNTKGNDNIITQGSGIAVADGQCMIIVDQGRVVEICAEPGEYTYDMSTEASVFSGPLGEGIKNTFKSISNRLAYGGDTGKDQRIYYFNLKEMADNKFGTQNPVPFRVTYPELGRSFTAGLRCNGVYSYQIKDPLLFYTNVCGNVPQQYTRGEIEARLKAEFLDALQPAFGAISDMGIRYDQITLHNKELKDAMNNALAEMWLEKRGLIIGSIAINSVTMSKEDEDRIKKFEDLAWNRDPLNAAAVMTEAQANAMQTAAGNSAGAMMGFMGMNMAQANGGMNAQNLFAMGQQQAAAAQQAAAQQQAAQPSANTWTCACGTKNTGKFCLECGKPKPTAAGNGWTCGCGTVNKGKFCMECGKPKPAAAPLYKCDKCGWEPADPTKPPKFCPECGDVFDENDVKQ
ncbi:MAG: SPFH domain-containing protein [Oscillospiraceae bacterium]|nr:SPFH domain-containing protein [Oscillospiraceae bacterium]